jgi:glutamate dehydrogenase (NAD(P)+)
MEPMSSSAQRYFEQAARILNLGAAEQKLLLTPLREVRVQIAMRMDDGRLETFVGYRIQHDKARGPMKGACGSIPRSTPRKFWSWPR